MATAADPTAALWVQRFRATRMSLPHWGRDAPQRCVYVSTHTGTVEVFAWDRDADTHRQVTDRPNGTRACAIEAAGEHVWWFSDTDGDEFGTWQRQPFEGGADEPAVPGLRPGYPAGLMLGRTVWVVGQQDDDGSRIWVHRAGTTDQLYAHDDSADVQAMSDDETLVVYAHSEHGDARHRALRAVRLDGSVAGELYDGPSRRLDAVGFPQVPGDQRLLVLHERAGRTEPLLWDLATGTQTLVPVDLPGEVRARWYPDGSALLVRVDHRARTRAYRLDLATGELGPVTPAEGTVTDAVARPDGRVEYSWSSAAQPQQLRDSDGGVLVRPPGPAAPPSVPAHDVEVPGPGGTVHALLCLPEGTRPFPTVFLVHGGPEAHDRDVFSAGVAAWVDHGYAVVRVNYRGSDGYGPAWRDAIEHRPGLVELEDVAAVHDRLVADGTADPARCVIAGASWGGFLTLLGLGTQPERWTLGIAGVPVADYLAAYEDEMEPLQAFDRGLFGGSPEEVPDRYERSSPITYAEQVRAPVLVLAGRNDPRCPIRQIENYLARLDELGRPYEVYRYEAGHGSLVVEEQVRQLRAELDFAARHLSGVSAAL